MKSSIFNNFQPNLFKFDAAIIFSDKFSLRKWGFLKVKKVVALINFIKCAQLGYFRKSKKKTTKHLFFNPVYYEVASYFKNLEIL